MCKVICAIFFFGNDYVLLPLGLLAARLVGDAAFLLDELLHGVGAHHGSHQGPLVAARVLLLHSLLAPGGWGKQH